MSKRLRNREVCADCSAPGPCWASVNRGVLICDECCSIHRGLGRHSSQVRHLTHTPWPPSQLQMVQTLYSNGANSIWEHSLLDPSSVSSGKRKANPQDRVHPHKTDFIKAKYQMLAYVHRMPCREDDSVTTKDLSKQLHSSVRTGNLETCLRLLSLGAQANFFHPEKGNSPLHVAAKAGQVSQAELLAVYGADPGALDTGGKTPIDYARQAGHQELADRLLEIQYELTDRLAFYLCGRKPDHRNGQHFIIPQMADSSLDLSEFAKAAKKKLQSLTNHQFEELAMDVYDEVDRREMDAVWLATQNHSSLVTDTTVVPFLPVNPEYSSTRNQGRQKLARFNAHEFATLVIDILTDAKRRQRGTSCESPREDIELILKGIGSRHGSESQDNEDQPDYDSVASDEDLEREPTSGNNGKEGRTKSSESSDLSDGPITVQEFLEVKSALTASEAKIQQLLKVNCHLSEELRMMQTKLNSLQTENSSLRWQSGPQHSQDPSGCPPVRGGRPMSMYETGSGMKQYPHRGEPPRRNNGLNLQPLPTNIGRGPLGTASSSLPTFPSSLSWSRDERARRGCSLEGHGSVLESDYDNAPKHSGPEESGVGRNCRLVGSSTSEQGQAEDGSEADSTLPCTEDVICRTEQITKNIQELLRAAQENKHESSSPGSLGCFSGLLPCCEAGGCKQACLNSLEPCFDRATQGCLSTLLACSEGVERAPASSVQTPPGSGSGTCFVPCSERIHVAVREMATLFPKRPYSDTVRGSLRLLTSSASRLQEECQKATPHDPCPSDMQLVTQQVIQCAYDIAKAAKQLVTVTTKENSN
ncbi:ARF GTPase-activating protein GIT2 isoform X2 [Esox lucius]|uniref:Arf-GAP domain-containing protein n=1 Tax=Esox lucius TaxID=8010 RepID=A0A3P8Z2F3_ESOLU|nr:ARF GTPase-activating protein GIT2 isoform X2 [Esox lucius]